MAEVGRFVGSVMVRYTAFLRSALGYGIERMAVQLTRVPDAQGKYEGFDIAADGIKRWQRQITPRYPNFRFHHANIYNKMYNPSGSFSASTYHFPYPDNDFDLVLCTSVFTHMLPNDLDHYLEEIARVMKPGARFLLTLFVANDEALHLMRQGKSMFDFS